MKLYVFLLALSSLIITCNAQETVFISASGNAGINAQLFLQNNSRPFILLFHERDNTEEYAILSSRFMNLNYNCLSVVIKNSGNQPAVNDILSAIAYARKICNKPVILFGSGRLASLCLLSARKNNNVKAVIALSPGEYFQPGISIRDAVNDISQQVFVCSSEKELPYIKEMFFKEGTRSNITLFKPEKSATLHGSAVLDESNPSGSEYWFALMMFFKNLANN